MKKVFFWKGGKYMNLTDFSVMDLTNALFRKLLEMVNIHIDKIDLGSLTTSIITTLIIIFTSAFVLWLLKAVGLYVMAKNKNDDLAFISFIPYGCLFTKGRILGNTKLFGIEIAHPEYLLPLLALSMCLPYTRPIAMLLFVFFYFGILYRIYQMYSPNYAILFLILSIIFPILPPFFIFGLRNKQPQDLVQ